MFTHLSPGTVLAHAALSGAAAGIVWILLVIGALGVEVATGGSIRLARSLGCPPVVQRGCWRLARAQQRLRVSPRGTRACEKEDS